MTVTSLDAATVSRPVSSPWSGPRLTRTEMPNETIEALALRCGFTSKSQLARAFKDFYGMTPSQARTDGRRTIGDPSIARLHRRLEFFSP